MVITKSPVWDAFTGTETFQDFQNNYLRPLYFKDEVNDDIKAFGEVVNKLVCFGYYEYEFIDIALTHAIFTFEKALKIRWEEIHNTQSPYKFKGMIDWFCSNNYFETVNEQYPQILREIRNGKVHEATKSLGGVFYIQGIYNTFDLINDLYEDIHSRALRKREINTLTESLSKIAKEGAILIINHERHIIFEVYPVFINNKSIPNTLTFLTIPIFELSHLVQGKYLQPSNLTITISDWKINDDRLTGIEMNSGNHVALARIIDEVDKDKFEKWTKAFYELSHWRMIRVMAMEPMGRHFIKELSRLHKTK